MPAQQVARRLHEANIFQIGKSDPILKDLHSPLKAKAISRLPPDLVSNYQHFERYRTFNSSRKADCFCQIDESRIMRIHSFFKDPSSPGERFVCGSYIKVVKPLYKIPSTSHNVNEYAASLDDNNMDGLLSFTNVKNISGKFFHMPLHGTTDHAFSKLLHCMLKIPILNSVHIIHYYAF